MLPCHPQPEALVHEHGEHGHCPPTRGQWVQESSMGLMRNLENCLRLARNNFIKHTLSLLFGPCSVFVDLCKNIIESTAGLNECAIHGGQPLRGKILMALHSLGGELENVPKQMILYLENIATQGVFFRSSNDLFRVQCVCKTPGEICQT
jgi:hypothetical protein